MKRRRALSPVKWILLAVGVIAVVVIGVSLLRLGRPAVTVTEIAEGPAIAAFYATGTLEPADREHAIRAPVEGFIKSPPGDAPYIDKGDRVTKGQVLAVIFNEGYQYNYDKALADVKEKKARADIETSPVLQELDAKIANYGELVEAADREFRRYSASKEAKVVNQADYDRALDRLKTVNSEFESFKAQKLQMRLKLARELAEAESALKIATWNLDQTKIVSPVDGFVMDKPQQIGARIAINDPIVVIANTSPSNLVMRAQVDEEDVTKVSPPDSHQKLMAILQPLLGLDRLLAGWKFRTQPVQMSLYAFADRTFLGRVTRIYPNADQERRTFEVDIAIDEPSDRMQAGMTGELMFITAYHPKTLVAPSQALQDGKVWTIREGKLTAADVVVGLKGVERIEVVSGLKPGETVVISPVVGIAPGQSVRVGERIDPRIAAALNKPKEKELFRGGF